MNKIFLNSLLFICFTAVTNAQVKPLAATTINNKDLAMVNAKAILNSDAQEALNTWIEIYELPNYQGRMVRFNQSTNALNLPFVPDRFSIKRGNFVTTKVTLYTAGGQREDIVVKNDMPNERIGNYGLAGILFEPLPWVEIFELPDYKGRSVKFVEDVFFKENLNLPFSTNNASVKLANDNVMVHLSYECAGQKNYTTLDKNNSNLNRLGQICGLRIAKKGAVRIRFNGILTEIHNNDCKKMYGTIRYRIIEKDANGNTIGFCKTVKPEESDPWGWVTVYNVAKSEASIPANIYDINKYKINERDVLGNINRKTGVGYLFHSPEHNDTYVLHQFDSAAFKQNRLKMEVSVNIGSHHKGCDLCSDYTDNATMIRDDVREFAINVNQFQVQPGKYRSASGLGGFTGPEHATYLDFSYTYVSYSFYRQIFPY